MQESINRIDNFKNGAVFQPDKLPVDVITHCAIFFYQSWGPI